MNLSSLLTKKLENNLQEHFTTIDLLTPSECQRACSLIQHLRQFWLKQDASLPFYSLGTASYFHDPTSNPIEQYNSLIKCYSPLLWQNFSWLYQKLADTLASQLSAPICYPEHLALPGFHIFLAHKYFEQLNPPIHRDLQYRMHQWETTKATDYTETISFTLAIKLPQAGAGMNIWDLHHDEVDLMSPAEIESLVQSQKKYFFSYELGKLVLHSGHFIHQIASAKNIQKDDERITLQGHGFLTQGTWNLYW